MGLTTTTTSTKKRKKDGKNTPSTSPNKKKNTANDSAKDIDKSPTTPMLRSQSEKKVGEIATPTTPTL